MNTNMHGKKIERVEGEDGPSGNPRALDRKWGHLMELSATHHGDRDEFWVLVYNDEGRELERLNARTLHRIVWLWQP